MKSLAIYDGASQVAQTVRNLPTMQKTQVWSLGQEDLLEKRMATHSSILAWKIPWTEEPGRLQSMRLQRVRHDWATSTHTHTHERFIPQLLSPPWRSGSGAESSYLFSSHLVPLVNSIPRGFPKVTSLTQTLGGEQKMNNKKHLSHSYDSGNSNGFRNCARDRVRRLTTYFLLLNTVSQKALNTSWLV